MNSDLEVMTHLLDSMKELADKLDNASMENNLEKINKIKKEIFDISRKIDEELK